MAGECSKCGCQDRQYKSGTSTKGPWRGYKCQNKACGHMDWLPTQKGQQAQGGGSVTTEGIVTINNAQLRTITDRLDRIIKLLGGGAPQPTAPPEEPGPEDGDELPF